MTLSQTDIAEALPHLTEAEQAEIDELVESMEFPIWQPNPDHPDGRPNPQRLAYESKADILGYGGAAGGGKTDLIVGLAATEHYQSIIFRRIFKNLRGIIKRSREILNPDSVAAHKDSYNESLHRWKRDDGGEIELESMQYEADKQNFRGFPHDFYGFDEATEFSRSQVEFVLGWMRSTRPGQRCRAVLGFNPPLDDEGVWIIDFFLPWFAFLFPDDYEHPNPTPPGELLWYATIDGKEAVVESGEPFEHNGEIIKPLSRTFIPASLDDNPHLKDTNYRSVLQSMPEPLRSQLLYGDFRSQRKPNPWQVIPAAWVAQAQRRWMEREAPDMPVSGVGVDVARGGQDSLVVAKRRGTWFAEPNKTEGANVEDGPAAAGIIYQDMGDEENIGYINIDVIGVGTSAYDSAKAMWEGVTYPINAAARSEYIVYSKGDDPKPMLKMRNMRAEYHWKMREALDPANGHDTALPPGNEIVADLCAARYKMMAGGVVQIEEKEAIKARLGRSPDVGEAIMLCNLRPPITVDPAGEIIETTTDDWKPERKRNRLWR